MHCHQIRLRHILAHCSSQPVSTKSKLTKEETSQKAQKKHEDYLKQSLKTYGTLANMGEMRDHINIDNTRFKQSLSSLGVTFNRLTSQQKRDLSQNGFIIVKNHLSKVQLEQLRTVYDRLFQLEGSLAGTETHIEHQAPRLGDLVNKGSGIFDICWNDPVLLEAVYYVLGPFKLNSLNARHPNKGYGLQAFHSDTEYLNIWEWDCNGGSYSSSGTNSGSSSENRWAVVANSIFLLDDYTNENGATRVVPGSHLSGKHPIKVLKDCEAKHPNEIIINAKAGSLIIFNAHLWHGGTTCVNGAKRRTIHSFWIKRGYSQQTNQSKMLTRANSKRLNFEQHVLLDCLPKI